jgi:hypothetical protein
MIKTEHSRLLDPALVRAMVRAMPKTVHGRRLHAAFLGQRVRVAYKPKRNPPKPAGDVWVCLEFDFKERTVTEHTGRVPGTEARKWVDSLRRPKGEAPGKGARRLLN